MNTRRLRPRAAFTLVELLVVITIIGMLIALLMPAVNRARETAQQTTCLNNQRNYALAVASYVAAKEYFPGYRMTLKQNVPSTANLYPSVSWQIALLPQLERVDIYQTWQNYSDTYAGNGAAVIPSNPYMEIAVCPSDDTRTGDQNPWTSYVANGGTLDLDHSHADKRLSLPDTYSDQPMGIFQNHFALPNTPPRPLKLSLTDIRDGKSTTLLTSENLNARYYGFATTSKSNSISDEDNSERGTCFLHWWQLPLASGTPSILDNPPVAPDPIAVINGNRDDPTLDPNNSGWWPNPYTGGTANAKQFSARPSSNHPGGVVVTFVGGNTQFLRDDISYDVYCYLMTPAGSRFRGLNTPTGAEPPLDEGVFK